MLVLQIAGGVRSQMTACSTRGRAPPSRHDAGGEGGGREPPVAPLSRLLLQPPPLCTTLTADTSSHTGGWKLQKRPFAVDNLAVLACQDADLHYRGVCTDVVEATGKLWRK